MSMLLHFCRIWQRPSGVFFASSDRCCLSRSLPTLLFLIFLFSYLFIASRSVCLGVECRVVPEAGGSVRNCRGLRELVNG